MRLDQLVQFVITSVEIVPLMQQHALLAVMPPDLLPLTASVTILILTQELMLHVQPVFIPVQTVHLILFVLPAKLIPIEYLYLVIANLTTMKLDQPVLYVTINVETV